MAGTACSGVSATGAPFRAMQRDGPHDFVLHAALLQARVIGHLSVGAAPKDAEVSQKAELVGGRCHGKVEHMGNITHTSS